MMQSRPFTEYLASLFNATVRPSTLVELPGTKRIVDVLTMLRHEKAWPGRKPASMNSVPNKPAFQFNNQPAWAEFILLRLLERDGWIGAWVKNWHGRAFWRDPLEITELSPVWSKYWSEASISSIENLSALITVPVPHRRPG
jgi:hypothetical protein